MFSFCAIVIFIHKRNFLYIIYYPFKDYASTEPTSILSYNHSIDKFWELPCCRICLYHFGRKNAQKQMYVTCCERIEKVSCYKEVIKLIKTSYWKIIVFGKVCLVKMVQHLIWRLSLILMIAMKQKLVNDK